MSETEPGEGYDTMAELLAAEANGWTVTAMFRKETARTVQYYTRTYGPYSDKKDARAKATTMRRKVRQWAVEDPRLTVLAVGVEPLWKELP